MAKLTEAQMKRGRERFLAGNVEARQKIEALTQAHADAMYTPLDKLREAETMNELARVAHQSGKDPQELFFSHVADTAAEFEQLCKERNVAIEASLNS